MDTNPNLHLPLLSIPPNHHRSQPLYGLVLLIFVSLLSAFAAYESSKGFTIKVLKASESDSIAAQRFNLMYVSNGKAARILIRASQFVEAHLRANSNAELNVIRRLTLQQSSQTMSSAVEVVESRNEHEFVLILNPELLLERMGSDADAAVVKAILRGMTRVWMRGFYGQLGADTSVTVAEELEESVIRKATEVHLSYFHKLIG